MKTYRYLYSIILIILIVLSCRKKNEEPTPLLPANVTDIDGNVYTTIKIGQQVWMKENLKVKHYRNGDLINTISDTINISYQISPKYQWACNGNENNVATYGRLYTWYTITDSRNICPQGWHIPSKAEWDILISNEENGIYEAGAALKEVGTVHWDSTLHAPGKDRFGFCALPSGCMTTPAPFQFFREACFWWTSTADINDDAWYRSIFNSSSEVYNYSDPKYHGFSVRCIKD